MMCKVISVLIGTSINDYSLTYLLTYLLTNLLTYLPTYLLTHLPDVIVQWLDRRTRNTAWIPAGRATFDILTRYESVRACVDYILILCQTNRAF